MLDQEQDKDWAKNRHIELFNRFCDLVVNHYRESREVKYYADQLSLTPKYLSKVIRETTGGISPSEWIEQYVTETAYELGFYEPTAFYRYFKRVTGMTAKEYRDSRNESN